MPQKTDMVVPYKRLQQTAMQGLFGFLSTQELMSTSWEENMAKLSSQLLLKITTPFSNCYSERVPTSFARISKAGRRCGGPSLKETMRSYSSYSRTPRST